MEKRHDMKVGRTKIPIRNAKLKVHPGIEKARVDISKILFPIEFKRHFK